MAHDFAGEAGSFSGLGQRLYQLILLVGGAVQQAHGSFAVEYDGAQRLIQRVSEARCQLAGGIQAREMCDLRSQLTQLARSLLFTRHIYQNGPAAPCDRTGSGLRHALQPQTQYPTLTILDAQLLAQTLPGRAHTIAMRVEQLPVIALHP